jgi:acyl-CoA thioesterase FadM
LILKYDQLLSNFAFDFKLRRYTDAIGDVWYVTVAAAEVTCTCLARDSGRPVPCPPHLADRFAALVSSQAAEETG